MESVNILNRHSSSQILGSVRLTSTEVLFILWTVDFSSTRIILYIPCTWVTNLPGQSIAPVPVHLPVTDAAQTVVPPQVIAFLDDHIPVFARHRGVTQALHVQLAEDPHTHLCRECLREVQLWSSIPDGHQGDDSFSNSTGLDVPFRDMLHLSASPYTPLNYR